MAIGAKYLGNKVCEFTVWAPLLKKVELKILLPHLQSLIVMNKNAQGYWKITTEAIPGTKYIYRLNEEKERPDPASHFQPDGVHQASQVIDHNIFPWTDINWQGMPFSDKMIIYEIHTGTFTQEGTFEAIIPQLDILKELGINTIELMPISQFSGKRNWGYDGTYPFAVQNSYGGPEGLKKLVNACHQKQIAVVLDVVYNHLGPEGNYLWDFGPYFTNKYKTPWGEAINLDNPYSDAVRNFFIENAIHWLTHYHIDGLRLDAIHAITDMSSKHFLRELAERVEIFSRMAGKKIYLIAESDLNDTRIIQSFTKEGFGLDAQWNDDFHHSLHTLLTKETNGYYSDFGQQKQLIKSFQEGFVYSGEYSEHRKRNHGNSSKEFFGHQFVVCAQNHDQIGNRMLGERLSQLISFEACKLAASATLLSPYIPLLFMGEEYGETAPFLYFVSHSNPALIEAVRKGRKQEFASFQSKGETPDPQAESTFYKSKLNWETREQKEHKILWDFYRYLISLRKEIPALAYLSKNHLLSGEIDDIIWMKRWFEENEILCLFNFNESDKKVICSLVEGKWKIVFNSADKIWNGPDTLISKEIVFPSEIILHPWSAILFQKK